MKRVQGILYLVLLLSLPVFCYGFLDQLYVNRFLDFSQKWLARESRHLAESSADLKGIMAPYRGVADVADDLIGFGVVRNGVIIDLYRVDERTYVGWEKSTDLFVHRVGFLQFNVFIPINGIENTYVFFTLLDDMAYINFMVLLSATLLCFGIAFFMRSRMSILREDTIRKTTVLAIKSLAHDFRAPFGKLRIFMNQLGSIETKQNPHLLKMRDDLDAAVEHADDVLIDFLSLDSKPSKAPVNCKQLVEKLEKKYFAQWHRDYENVKLDFMVQDDIAFLGDEKKTLRVLFNLIDNALKHAESKVFVVASREKNEVAFKVENDGPEIPDHHLAKIYEPFFSKRKGGVGLGLFIAQSLTRLQGAKLVCTSVPSSTIFSFALAWCNESLTPVQQSPKRVNTKHYKIAYVDDENFYLDALEDLLKGSGIVMERFLHTDDVLLSLKAGQSEYDLILVDRYGPHFDAVQDRFDESCRDYGYKGPIVLYSNSVVDQENVPGFSRVFDKTKPLSLDEIRSMIEQGGK